MTGPEEIGRVGVGAGGDVAWKNMREHTDGCQIAWVLVRVAFSQNCPLLLAATSRGFGE